MKPRMQLVDDLDIELEVGNALEIETPHVEEQAVRDVGEYVIGLLRELQIISKISRMHDLSMDLSLLLTKHERSHVRR